MVVNFGKFCLCSLVCASSVALNLDTDLTLSQHVQNTPGKPGRKGKTVEK